MPDPRHPARLFHGFLAVVLLVLGQNVAALHSGNHDDGALGSSSCAACVTAHLLSSACIDAGPRHFPHTLPSQLYPAAKFSSTSVELRDPRQRGPPHSA